MTQRDKCVECHRPMRFKGEPKSAAPNLIGQSAKGMCAGCYPRHIAAKKAPEPEHSDEYTEEEARVLVSIGLRFPGRSGENVAIRQELRDLLGLL